MSAGQAVTRDEELNEVYRKTQKYVERFNQMSNKEKDHQGKNDEMPCREYFLATIIFHPIESSLSFFAYLIVFCGFLDYPISLQLLHRTCGGIG